MSFLERWFGGKKGDKPPTTGEAIQELRDTEDMLYKKSEFLESKIEQELKIIKLNGLKNKRAALLALKRKKRYEKQLQQIDGTLSTLEMQRESLENSNTNTAVLQTMKNAADALKAAHKHMDVDQIHDMMDDIAEQQEMATEISDLISNPFGYKEDIDEDELLLELEKLEQEQLDEELISVAKPAVVELPEVPKGDPSKAKAKVPAKKTEGEDDMKELEEWAS